MLKKVMLASCLFFMAAGINASNSAEDDIKPMCWNGDQITGPIWSNDDAQRVCPAVCGNIRGTWTGHWVTVIWGERSVCNCRVC